MTQLFDGLSEDQLSVIGTQVKPGDGHAVWFKIGTTGLSILIATAIWFYKIAPDEKSPSTLMVEPATELLSSFVQPVPDVSQLSRDLGFRIVAPDLKPLGAELTTIGESDFGGRHAAVIEYKRGYSDYLLYSFAPSQNLLSQMRKVDCEDCQFFIVSEGAVSVVVWKDRRLGYRALAGKETEQDLLNLAENIARIA